MAQYQVSYQVGRREPSGTFVAESSVWYTVTVESNSVTNAQRQVQAMNGGHNHCLIGATFEKNNLFG